MKRLVGLFMIVTVLALAPAASSAENDDMLSGFALGKYYTSTNMLAMELTILKSLSDELKLGMITDENYESGAITDEDIEGASMVLTYAIWRLQFIIIPLAEAGLEEDSFEEPIFDTLREPTQELLEDLLAKANECLATADFVSVAVFADEMIEFGYADMLIGFGDEARVLAGAPES